MVLTEDQIILERCEKFLSPIYWTDINIRSQMYPSIEQIEDIRYIAFAPGQPHIKINQAQNIFGEEPDIIRKRAVVGDSFGPSWSTVWFRISFLFPEPWIHKTIGLRWDSSSEAMLYDLEGKHLQAFTGGDGPDRRDLFILPLTNTSEEEYIVFYVEMACNGMFGNGNDGMIRPPDPDRMFLLRSAEFVEINVPINALFWDLTTLHSIGTYSIDASLQAESIAVINKILNRVDLNNEESVLQCRHEASRILNTMHSLSDMNIGTPIVTSHMNHEITAVGHCHIDTAWLWSYKETRRKVARSWSTQLQLLDTYPCWRFVASQTVQWEWLQQDHPELFSRIQHEITTGRFIPIGGSYVEFDANIPSTESMIRQFLYGMTFFQQQLHVTTDVFWLPDTFGYSAQLPQIMRGFGIKYFLSQKLSWNLFNKFPHTTFTWQGLDGSSVLAHFPPADTYNSSATCEDIIKCVSNHKSLKSSNRSLLLFGHGDGGGGPAVSHLEQLSRYQSAKSLPQIHIQETPSAFFQKAEEDFQRNSDAVSIPCWVGELYLELHQGTLTSQASIKKLNRKCESLLRTLEALLVCVFLHGCCMESEVVVYKQQLRSLWKDVLLNQFHDVIPGSSIQAVYDDANTMLSNVIVTGEDLLDVFVSFLFPSETGQNVIIVNMSHYCRRLWFESVYDPASAQQPYSFMTVPIDKPPKFDESQLTFLMKSQLELVLENDLLRAEFSPSGALLSLIDKKNKNREVIKRGFTGNTLVLYDDVPFYWDAWDVFEYHKFTGKSINSSEPQEGSTTPMASSVKYEHSILQDPERGVGLLFQVSQWGGSSESSVEQRVFLSSTAAVIEFETTVQWKEAHKLLKVEFPLAINSQEVSYEMQGGFVKRPTHRNTPYDAAKFEVCGHRYADISEGDYGVALLNDCKYGYSCRGSTLCLSLLRAPKAPDPTCDMGTSSFRYGLFVHKGGSVNAGRVTEAASTFSAPVMRRKIVPSNFRSDTLTTASDEQAFKRHRSTIGDFPKDTSLFFITEESSGGLVIDTIKLAEDGDGLIVRLVEVESTRGKATIESLVCTFKSVHMVNLMENPMDEAEVFASECAVSVGRKNTQFEVVFSPFKIVTVRVRLS